MSHSKLTYDDHCFQDNDPFEKASPRSSLKPASGDALAHFTKSNCLTRMTGRVCGLSRVCPRRLACVSRAISTRAARARRPPVIKHRPPLTGRHCSKCCAMLLALPDEVAAVPAFKSPRATYVITHMLSLIGFAVCAWPRQLLRHTSAGADMPRPQLTPQQAP